MKHLIIFAVLFVFVSATKEECYAKTADFCKPPVGKDIQQTAFNCSATFGGIKHIKPKLQKYIDQHILASFDFILFSTHFDNYESSRPGFSKLYRKLSDGIWENAIETIKHLTKRGASMQFNLNNSGYKSTESFQLTEVESLGSALDIVKQLAESANDIHSEVSHTSHEHTDSHLFKHDGEIADYMQDQLEHKAETIRELSGHVNDVKMFLTDNITSVSLFMFDEYLLKS